MKEVINPQHEKIIQVQKEAWNKSSSGWKKWDGLMMSFLKPVTDKMTGHLNLKNNSRVLDVATGTGEPGLTIASIAKEGSVTATDLSEEMLLVAKENAAKRGLTNFKTVNCESSNLPFEVNEFDAVTCRFSFMFFPDMAQSLIEMMRVLRQGGQIVASYWNGPEKNFWVSNSMEVMMSELNLNPPAPGAPGLYRCAQPGLMRKLFEDCGYSEIKEEEIPGQISFSSEELYWNFITGVASPMAYFKADEETQLRIKSKVFAKLKEKNAHGKIELASSATIISGMK